MTPRRRGHYWIASDGLDRCAVDPDFDAYDGDPRRLSVVPIADLFGPQRISYDFLHCNRLVESFKNQHPHAWIGVEGPPWPRKTPRPPPPPKPIDILSAMRAEMGLDYASAYIEDVPQGFRFTNPTTEVWVTVTHPTSLREIREAANILRHGKKAA